MKHKKKIIGLVLLFVVLIGMLAVLLLNLLPKDSNEEVVKTAWKPEVEWYDENGTEFVITTAEQLYDLEELSYFYTFEGQTIKLGADIVVNEGNAEDWAEEAPERNWYPIRDFAGTFDGQGHTISGIYQSSVDIGTGLFVATHSECVIQDFKLVNSYFESKGSKGTSSIASVGNGTFKKIYSDAIIRSENLNTAGIVSRPQAEVVIQECWFDGSIETNGRYVGGIVDIIVARKATIEHCLNTAPITCTWEVTAPSVGGICGVAMNEGANVLINDCFATGTIDVVSTWRVGSLYGGSNEKAVTTIKDSYVTKESYTLGVGNVVYNLTGGSVGIKEENLIGKGGYEWTSLDFENFWTIVKDGTPILKSFAEEVPSVSGLEKKFSYDWYDADATEYTLKTVEDLYGFTMLSGCNNFKEKIIKLGANITVNKGNAADWAKKAPALEWIPIGIFRGTFDGQGHTISGLYAVGKTSIGLFERVLADGTVKNLYLKNSYFRATGDDEGTRFFVGSIVARGGGTIDTIYSNAIVETYGTAAGGIVGQMNVDDPNNKITNCWFDGTVILRTEKGINGGGIVGTTVLGHLAIEHCLYTGKIISEVSEKGARVGGIIGTVEYNDCTFSMKDCLSVGTIQTNNQFNTGALMGGVCTRNVASITDSYAATEVFCRQNGQAIITNTIGTGVLNGNGTFVNHDKLLGLSAYQWTGLDFKKYWVPMEGDTPMLKSFAKGKGLSTAGVAKAFNTDWYKESATEYTLDSKEDLLGFMLLASTRSFAGKTINVAADITVNTGNAADWSKNAPAIVWAPTDTFSGTFNGNGHTISGIYATGEYATGFFGRTSKESVIKNLSLTNSYFGSPKEVTNYGLVGGLIGRGGGLIDTVYCDAIVESSRGAAGGFIGQMNAGGEDNKITNSWFNGTIIMHTENGRNAGGFVGTHVLGELTVEHCLSSGTITSETENLGSRLGGIAGTVEYNKAVMHVNDCLSVGTITTTGEGNSQYHAGSIIGAVCTETSASIKNTFAATETYRVNNGEHIDATALGTAVLTGSSIDVYRDWLIGDGGYQWTNLDFAKYWAVDADGTPKLKSFEGAGESTSGLKKSFSTAWYDEDAKEYVLNSKEDLYGFAMLSQNNDFKGKTIKLGKTIDVNDDWKPIETFAGTFDGDSYAINGIHAAGEYAVGLFARTTVDSSIKNLTLTDSTFTSPNKENSRAYVGALVGRGGGTIDTVHVDAVVESSYGGAGGFIGQVNQAGKNTITNSWFSGTVNMKTYDAAKGGGFVGTLNLGALLIEHSLFDGTVTSEVITGGSRIGGFVGTVQFNDSLLMINDCLSVGTIVPGTGENAIYQTGSLVGKVYADANISVSNTYSSAECYNTAYTVDEGKGDQQIKGDQWKEYLLVGKNGYAVTSLDFAEYWVALAERTPALASFNDITPLSLDGVIQADTSWYAENLETKEYTIANVSELYGLSYLSQKYNFSGWKLTLEEGKTYELNTGNATDYETQAPVNEWIAIGRENANVAFAGNFNGQGATIEGLYINSNEKLQGLFGRVEGGTVSNFRLEDSYIASDAEWTQVGSIAGLGNGTFADIFSNAFVKNTGSVNAYYTGGLVGYATGNITIKGCWFDGNVTSNGTYVGGLLGMASAATQPGKGTALIKTSLNSGVVTSTGIVNGDRGYTGGLVGYTEHYETVTLEDCLSAGTVSVAAPARVGSVLGQVAGNITNIVKFINVYTTDNISNNAGKTLDFLNCGVGNKSLGTYSGATGKLDATHKPHAKAVADLSGYTVYNTGLDFADTDQDGSYWIARATNTPILIKFADKGTNLIHEIDTEWYTANQSTKTYTIQNLAELYGFAKLSQTTNFSGWTINLVQNKEYKLNDGNAADWEQAVPKYGWISIGRTSGDVAFAGTFNGNGATISGLYIDASTNLQALFGRVNGGTITNLKLKNSYIASSSAWTQVASIAGLANGTFTNVYSEAIVKNKATSNACYAGGLIGYANGTTTLTGCQFVGTITSGMDTGGLVGYATGNITFAGCRFNGQLTTTSSRIGGILGNATKNVTIKGCLAEGAITSGGIYAGGLIGLASAQPVSSGTITIKTSMNAATVTSRGVHSNGGGYTGGLCGYIENYQTVTMEDSLNTGSISVTATDRVGSVLGQVAGNITNKVKFINVFTTDDIVNNAGKTLNFLNCGTTNKSLGTFSGATGKLDGTHKPQAKTTQQLTGANANTIGLGFVDTDNDGYYWVANTTGIPQLANFATK